MYTFWGNIIEIEDDNTIIVKIKRNDGGYTNGDTIKVKFTDYYEANQDDLGQVDIKTVPQINDNVVGQFWESDVIDDNGMDLIEIEKVHKYVEK